MTKRKSTSGTPSRSTLEMANLLSARSASSSTGTPLRFNNPAYALVKCNICQGELTKKDLTKHEESICKTLIESSRDLTGESYSASTSKENLFEHPLLLNRHIVVAPYTMSISKDKLKNIDSIPAHDNLLLLSPELMSHCNVLPGQHVSVRYMDSANRPQQHYLATQPYEMLKSALSVSFIRESPSSKALFTKEGSACSNVQIDLTLCTETLKSLAVRVMHNFKDSFAYLKECVTIKQKLVHKVIHPKDTEIRVTIDENTEYQLAVVSLQHGSDDDPCTDSLGGLDQDISRLSLKGSAVPLHGNKSLSEKPVYSETSKPAANLVHIVTEQTKIIFTDMECNTLTPDIRPLMGYSTQQRLLERLIIDKPICASLLPRTILLTGPSGVGKSHAMKCVFRRVQLRKMMNVCKLDCSRMLTKSFEYDKLRLAFRHLVALKPSLLFMDNLEDISSSEKVAGDRRFFGWLKMILDELQDAPTNGEPVIVVAATNRPELLDSSLRRPGRFDVEVEFPIPTPADRKQILVDAVKNSGADCKHIEFEQIWEVAELAHGFTGADLKHLCRMALLPEFGCGEDDDAEAVNEKLTFRKLHCALRSIKPSIMREISLEKPNVQWKDIGGLHSLRHLLQETVVWPVKHPEAFVRLGIDPPRGILMYGPPGCCKTMIGKALANESGLNFFSIKGPELFSKWVGESERAIREMFRKARAAAPSILFFDEIDALAAERGQAQSAVGDRVLAQLLTEIDGVEKLGQVAIIAATNRPDIVDKALLRPGRLDSIVYVPMPDLATRKEIFQIQTTRMRLPELQDTERAQLIDELAAKSEGYTGAEVTAVCQRAGLIALGENLKADSVSREHFMQAFERVKPRIGAKMIAFYDEFANRSEDVTRK